MPRKTNFKKIGRSKQGKSSSDFALESIPIEFEFDMDTITISDDKKVRKSSDQSIKDSNEEEESENEDYTVRYMYIVLTNLFQKSEFKK